MTVSMIVCLAGWDNSKIDAAFKPMPGATLIPVCLQNLFTCFFAMGSG
jgi:hypothetical protein